MSLSLKTIQHECEYYAEDLGLPRLTPSYADLDYLLYLIKRYRTRNPAAFREDSRVGDTLQFLAACGYLLPPSDRFPLHQEDTFQCANCGMPLTHSEITESDRVMDAWSLPDLISFYAKITPIRIPIRTEDLSRVHYLSPIGMLRVNLCHYCRSL